MRPEVAALLGSLIGAFAAVVGATLSHIAVVRTEQRRQRFAKNLADIEALRERSGAAFAEFLGVLQLIEWITWLGVNDPSSLDRARIAKYDDDVNQGYSRPRSRHRPGVRPGAGATSTRQAAA